MTRALDDKVVLITGAARGIGAATARRLAALGARLSLVGLEPEGLAALAAELGSQHVWFECDVTSSAALERAVAGTVAALGGIDVVLANAGIANNSCVAINPPDALARTIDVNLTGVVRTVSATLGAVEARRGYYLLVSSGVTFVAFPGMAAYCASKVGVEYFGGALRRELRGRGIGVGVAHPSWIDTDLVRDLAHEIPVFHAVLALLPWPLRRINSLEECAGRLAEAVLRRERTVYVPRSLFLVALLRNIIASRLGDALIAWRMGPLLPRLERETQALQRAFGRTSVENRRASPSPSPTTSASPSTNTSAAPH